MGVGYTGDANDMNAQADSPEWQGSGSQKRRKGEEDEEEYVPSEASGEESDFIDEDDYDSDFKVRGMGGLMVEAVA